MRPSSYAIKDRPSIPVGGSQFRAFERDAESQSFFLKASISDALRIVSYIASVPKKPTFLIRMHTTGWAGDGSCQLWYMESLGENADASFKSISIPQIRSSIDPHK